ncbi:hypothetical protein CLAFUW4_14818 [Fulvia fulva]|nr:hypothetical protein CLAFUR0_14811 [Fulvia fulva]WPV23008.1 hypothetical protein CLAFUW4_14818 [Fulvia fulva]WPV37967.1 hypothetical protein CLAFUW7_14819 [Fulvia fulva]
MYLVTILGNINGWIWYLSSQLGFDICRNEEIKAAFETVIIALEKANDPFPSMTGRRSRRPIVIDDDREGEDGDSSNSPEAALGESHIIGTTGGSSRRSIINEGDEGSGDEDGEDGSLHSPTNTDSPPSDTEHSPSGSPANAEEDSGVDDHNNVSPPTDAGSAGLSNAEDPTDPSDNAEFSRKKPKAGRIDIQNLRQAGDPRLATG